MENKYRRVFITGASGTGKTTLARMVTNLTGLPFISTSAKHVWPRFGFKSHKQAHHESIVNSTIGLQYQVEVLKQRVLALQNQKYFVTDRSPFDNYAYFLLTLGHVCSEWEREWFRKECEQQLYLANALILVRYPDAIRLEDDGFRINNPDYQLMVDSIINLNVRKLLKHTMPILEINTWDLKEKTKLITEFLKDVKA